jgi:hypothetical protein
MKEKDEMKEKEGTTTTGESSLAEATIAPEDQPLDVILQRLPSHYRKEILKQYDLPVVKVSILTILRYAAPLEVVMQVVGLIMAIAAGIPSPYPLFWTAVDLYRRRLTFNDNLTWKLDKFVWWIYIPWNTLPNSPSIGRRLQNGSISSLHVADIGIYSSVGSILHRNWRVGNNIYRNGMLDRKR